MSDQTTIIDKPISEGQLVVNHICYSEPHGFGIKTFTRYEVLIDDRLVLVSNDAENIMQLLAGKIS